MITVAPQPAIGQELDEPAAPYLTGIVLHEKTRPLEQIPPNSGQTGRAEAPAVSLVFCQTAGEDRGTSMLSLVSDHLVRSLG
jgi:hypothetical protein